MNDRLHRVIGIDLGTTYSAVAAYSSATDSPEIIYDPTEGKPHGATTPSVVWLNRDRKVTVGKDAKQAIAAFPADTVIEIKREMGERFNEELLDLYGARGVFRLGDPLEPENPSDPVKVFFAGEWLLPQEISAFILKRMKQVAEAELGGEIHDAVVTVPAYFTEPRTAATKEAALLAGLYPRQLIPEPTAAAICYGVDTAEVERKVYLVYDLGGGTFDVSIIVAQEGSIEVISTSGDPRLGGGDFDDAITAWVLARLGVDANPALTRKIKVNAEIAKRDLALHETTEVQLPPLTEGEAPPPAMTLDRATFEELIDGALRKSLDYVDEAIALAEVKGIAREAIDAILLVGGSTRIPRVKKMLVEHFKRAESFVNTDADPDTIVARGAAIVARKFAPSTRFAMSQPPEATLVSQDLEDEIGIGLITEHTLSVGVQQNRVDPLIARGRSIPCKETEVYINPENATGIRCPIYQGEKEFQFDNELIGIIDLGEIEPRPEGFHHFEVTFSLDLDGLLDVVIKHHETGKTYSAKFEQSQNTRIGEMALEARRSFLDGLYDDAQLRPEVATVTEPPPSAIPPPVTAAAPPEEPPAVPAATEEAAPPEPEPPPSAGDGVPAQPPAPDAGPAQPELVEIEGEVPAEFKATVRRVQRFLLQQPDEALAAAYNAFATGLNAEAPSDQLEELGDELADAFDDARLNLR